MADISAKVFSRPEWKMWKFSMQEDGDGTTLVIGYVIGRSSADTPYRTSVEYRTFILARSPQPPLGKRNGSALLLYILPAGAWASNRI